MIAVATRNRRAITHLALANLSSFRGAHRLEIWDDDSVEFGEEWLSQFGEVTYLNRHLGINRLRELQIEKFLASSGEERLYLTDSDAIHDPAWLIVAESLLMRHQRPVCLFNSRNHSAAIEAMPDRYERWCVRKTFPGISIYLSREMVEAAWEKSAATDVGSRWKNWDWDLGNYLSSAGFAITQSVSSYVEHFGKGGIHNGDNFGDTAQFPTSFLQRGRDVILFNAQAKAGEAFEFVTRSVVEPAFYYRSRRVQQHPLIHYGLRVLLGDSFPARIVELGTGGGGFSLLIRDMLRDLEPGKCPPIFTFDIQEPPNGLELEKEDIYFSRRNVLDAKALQDIGQMVASAGTTIVFCDGGNRKAEFAHMAECAKCGDFVLAHDYAPSRREFDERMRNRLWNWFEIGDDAIRSACEAYKLRECFSRTLNPLAWTCWRKT